MNDAGDAVAPQGRAHGSMVPETERSLLVQRPESRPEFESPSLTTDAPGESPAYEVKFELDELTAARVEQSFSSWMSLDPHADALLDHSYRITSLYSDTPAFDVFHRVGPGRRSKFRVRRYGESQQVFLECKSKHDECVTKRRVAIAESELEWLTDERAPLDWNGSWYRSGLVSRLLRPVCQVSYLRRAYFGVTPEGRLRLTFDREVRGCPTQVWSFDQRSEELRLGKGTVICEFKFRGAMPAPFKAAIEQFQMIPRGFSKYRTLVEAFGLVEPKGGGRA
jgi:hypothetical protein